MDYMQEMGLSLENCELWLERVVFAVLAVLFVIMIIRVSHDLIIIQWLIKSSDLAAFPSCCIILLHSLDKALSTWTIVVCIIKFNTLARNATYLPPSREYHRFL